MPDFIIFSHNDIPPGGVEGDWTPYLTALRAKGVFQGGSSIGEGICLRKAGAPGPFSARLNGYIRVTAQSLEAAQTLVAGNPVYEAGGTVEVRALPYDD